MLGSGHPLATATLVSMRTFNVVAGLASIIGLGVGVALIPGASAWLYPLPLIVLLAVLLIASWTYLATRLRSPDAHEQGRLDKLFGVLSGEAIRRSEDFGAPWPEWLTYPVQFFLHELQGAECQFRSWSLERRRVALTDAAVVFDNAEAMNGFGHPIAWSRRHTGFIEGELDIEPGKLAIASERRAEIHSAARALVNQHQRLVIAAKRRGFSLAALDGQLIEPPWKAELEEERRPATRVGRPRSGVRYEGARHL